MALVGFEALTNSFLNTREGQMRVSQIINHLAKAVRGMRDLCSDVI